MRPHFSLAVAYSLTLLSHALIPKGSPVTIPFARRMNLTGSANVVDQDRARSKAMREKSYQGQANQASIFDIPAQNQAVSYVASIGIGVPPTQYDLLIDTGSANTWLGANQTYVRTNSSQQTDQIVAVTYGSGFFVGVEYIDTVTLADGIAIETQSIGDGLVYNGFAGVDGILGIGPRDLTCGTLVQDSDACIDTVIETAYCQGLVSSRTIGISFEPTTSIDEWTGQLSFGGVDATRYNGEMNWTPLTTTAPASSFVGINQTITYGPSRTVIMDNSAGITDTGTTLLLIASDALAVYMSMTGAELDDDTGLLRISRENYDKLESLYFEISGVTYEFTPNAQTWPRALNEALGGEPCKIYLILGDTGESSGQGLDFIDGMSFLERFYYVYDIDNNRVGFAETNFTYATTN